MDIASRLISEPQITKLPTAGHINSVFEFFLEFINSEQILCYLQEELTSQWLGLKTLEDIKKSLPADANGWRSIAHTYLQNSPILHQNYLILIPSSHPLVGLHPILLGLSLGLNLYLRLDRTHHSRFTQSFIALVQKKFSHQIFIVPDSERIPAMFSHENHIFNKIEAIICFGSDETLDFLSENSSRPVIGFGDSISVGVLNQISDSEIEKVFYDAFCLGQRGCFSNRALFVHQSFNFTIELVDRLSQFSEILFDSHTDSKNLWNITDEIIETRLSHNECLKLVGGIEKRFPLFLIYDLEVINDKNIPIESLLSQRPWVLPVFYSENHSILQQSLLSISKLQTISCHPSLRNVFSKNQIFNKIRITDLGSANVSCWDGVHLGKYFF